MGPQGKMQCRKLPTKPPLMKGMIPPHSPVPRVRAEKHHTSGSKNKAIPTKNLSQGSNGLLPRGYSAVLELLQPSISALRSMVFPA